jgi:uncharacterized delta-60 repeat protein
MFRRELTVPGGFALLLLTVFNLQCSTCCAAPGDLDPTFGKSGEVRISFGGGHAEANASAVQADGKLILAGFGDANDRPIVSGGDFLIARFGTNNVLDPTFGDDGKVVTQVSTNYPVFNSSVIQAVQVQADGKILAAGYSYQITNYPDFTLVRYNPDGSLDTSFGTNGTGIVYTDFGQHSEIKGIVIQSDSNIVVAGFIAGSSPQAEGFALARYTTNGALDASFGTAGTIVTAGANFAANALLIEGDRKIVAVGTGTNNGDLGGDFAVFRYTTNGVLDTTFGGTGEVFTRITHASGTYVDSANAVAIQAGTIVAGNPDKIVVAGSSYFQELQAIARYNLDGSLDTNFGIGGIVTSIVGGGTVSCASVVVQGFSFHPRTITIGGSYSDGTNVYFGVNRYTASGALDTTFGTNSSGMNTFLTGSYLYAAANTFALQSGSYVVAGFRGFFESEYDFDAVRFTPSGLVDGSFGSNGLVLANVSDAPGAQAAGVAVQPDGKVIVAGTASIFNPVMDNNNEGFALARLNTDGSYDTSFGLNGKVTTLISTNDSSAQAVAIQADGKVIAAGGAHGSFAVLRYNHDGSLDNTFGSGGVVLSTIPGVGTFASAMRILADGKIVITGTVNTNNSQVYYFCVERYTTNGALDSTFGSGGVALAPIGTGTAQASGLGIQADGKIVVAGQATVGSYYDFALARYNLDGSLDNSYGFLGRVGTNFGNGTYAIGTSISIQPDGKIVEAGAAAIPSIVGNLWEFGLFRFTTNGNADASFGSGGGVLTVVGDYTSLGTGVYALGLQPDGKIIAAGQGFVSGNAEYAVVRYNTDGSVDNVYGTNGIAMFNFADGGSDTLAAVALDLQGRVVVAGNANGTFGVARLQTDLVISPTLKIFLTVTNTAVVSWPYPSLGWNLQQNTNLPTSAWTPPPQPIQNDGTNNFIVVTPGPGNGFYRLFY